MPTIPTLTERMAELIGFPSISSADPQWDQSNLGVIHALAGWCETLGFSVEIETVAPGKANLIATLGPVTSGTIPGGLVL